MPATNIRNEFKIKFDGELHEIDANTLITSLVNLSTIIQEVNSELKTGQKVEIKIKALDRGSFDINVLLTHAAMIAPALFSTNPGDIKNIIEILVGLLNLKKFLKGETPSQVNEDGDNVRIENQRGDSTVFYKSVFNMYTTNLSINSALNKSFEVLENEPAVTDLKILTAGEEHVLFSASKDEFEEMASPNKALAQKTQTIIKNGAKLNIFKLVFENRTNKWDFLYEGIKIAALIKDEEFLDKIDAGEQFAKGDALIVDLQIDQIFDEGVNAYMNSSYFVNRVVEHIPRSVPTQESISFEG